MSDQRPITSQRLQATHEALVAGAKSVMFSHDLVTSPLVTPAMQSYLSISQHVLAQTCWLATELLHEIDGIPLVQVSPERPLPPIPLTIIELKGFDPSSSVPWRAVAVPAQAVAMIKSRAPVPIPGTLIGLEPEGLKVQFANATDNLLSATPPDSQAI